MNIECIICEKPRHPRYYSKKAVEKNRWVCTECKRRTSIDTDIRLRQAMKVEQKIRTCLKCDGKFNSIDDNRVCNGCKMSPTYQDNRILMWGS